MVLIRTIRRMLHSSESKIRQILLNSLSVVNWRIVKMQHRSPFMSPPVLWITNYDQRAQYTFCGVCAIHLLSLWKNHDFVFPCAIKRNHEHSFVMEM
jgi:hypothetical protein